MKNNELTSFINSVMSENLLQAKTIITDELNKKLALSLEDKFDTYAASIHEDLDSVCKTVKGEDEDEAEGKDESEEEEESESEDEEDEEGDEDSEEDEEDSEEEKD